MKAPEAGDSPRLRPGALVKLRDWAGRFPIDARSVLRVSPDQTLASLQRKDFIVEVSHLSPEEAEGPLLRVRAAQDRFVSRSQTPQCAAPWKCACLPGHGPAPPCGCSFEWLCAPADAFVPRGSTVPVAPPLAPRDREQFPVFVWVDKADGSVCFMRFPLRSSRSAARYVAARYRGALPRALTRRDGCSSYEVAEAQEATFQPRPGADPGSADPIQEAGTLTSDTASSADGARRFLQQHIAPIDRSDPDTATAAFRVQGALRQLPVAHRRVPALHKGTVSLASAQAAAQASAATGDDATQAATGDGGGGSAHYGAPPTSTRPLPELVAAGVRLHAPFPEAGDAAESAGTEEGGEEAVDGAMAPPWARELAAAVAAAGTGAESAEVSRLCGTEPPSHFVLAPLRVSAKALCRLACLPAAAAESARLWLMRCDCEQVVVAVVGAQGAAEGEGPDTGASQGESEATLPDPDAAVHRRGLAAQRGWCAPLHCFVTLRATAAGMELVRVAWPGEAASAKAVGADRDPAEGPGPAEVGCAAALHPALVRGPGRTRSPSSPPPNVVASSLVVGQGLAWAIRDDNCLCSWSLLTGERIARVDPSRFRIATSPHTWLSSREEQAGAGVARPGDGAHGVAAPQGGGGVVPAKEDPFSVREAGDSLAPRDPAVRILRADVSGDACHAALAFANGMLHSVDVGRYLHRFPHDCCWFALATDRELASAEASRGEGWLDAPFLSASAAAGGLNATTAAAAAGDGNGESGAGGGTEGAEGATKSVASSLPASASAWGRVLLGIEWHHQARAGVTHPDVVAAPGAEEETGSEAAESELVEDPRAFDLPTDDLLRLSGATAAGVAALVTQREPVGAPSRLSATLARARLARRRALQQAGETDTPLLGPHSESQLLRAGRLHVSPGVNSPWWQRDSARAEATHAPDSGFHRLESDDREVVHSPVAALGLRPGRGDGAVDTVAAEGLDAVWPPQADGPAGGVDAAGEDAPRWAPRKWVQPAERPVDWGPGAANARPLFHGSHTDAPRRPALPRPWTHEGRDAFLHAAGAWEASGCAAPSQRLLSGFRIRRRMPRVHAYASSMSIAEAEARDATIGDVIAPRVAARHRQAAGTESPALRARDHTSTAAAVATPPLGRAAETESPRTERTEPADNEGRASTEAAASAGDASPRGADSATSTAEVAPPSQRAADKAAATPPRGRRGKRRMVRRVKRPGAAGSEAGSVFTAATGWTAGAASVMGAPARRAQREPLPAAAGTPGGPPLRQGSQAPEQGPAQQSSTGQPSTSPAVGTDAATAEAPASHGTRAASSDASAGGSQSHGTGPLSATADPSEVATSQFPAGGKQAPGREDALRRLQSAGAMQWASADDVVAYAVHGAPDPVLCGYTVLAPWMGPGSAFGAEAGVTLEALRVGAAGVTVMVSLSSPAALRELLSPLYPAAGADAAESALREGGPVDRCFAEEGGVLVLLRHAWRGRGREGLPSASVSVLPRRCAPLGRGTDEPYLATRDALYIAVPWVGSREAAEDEAVWRSHVEGADKGEDSRRASEAEASAPAPADSAGADSLDVALRRLGHDTPTARRLLRNLIVFQGPDLARAVCDLNGWVQEGRRISVASLSMALANHELDGVERALRSLVGPLRLEGSRLLTSYLRANWATSQDRDSFNQLIRIGQRFVASLVDEKRREVAASHGASVHFTHDLLFWHRGEGQHDPSAASARNLLALMTDLRELRDIRYFLNHRRPLQAKHVLDAVQPADGGAPAPSAAAGADGPELPLLVPRMYYDWARGAWEGAVLARVGTGPEAVSHHFHRAAAPAGEEDLASTLPRQDLHSEGRMGVEPSHTVAPGPPSQLAPLGSVPAVVTRGGIGRVFLRWARVPDSVVVREALVNGRTASAVAFLAARRVHTLGCSRETGGALPPSRLAFLRALGAGTLAESDDAARLVVASGAHTGGDAQGAERVAAAFVSGTAGTRVARLEGHAASQAVSVLSRGPLLPPPRDQGSPQYIHADLVRAGDDVVPDSYSKAPAVDVVAARAVLAAGRTSGAAAGTIPLAYVRFLAGRYVYRLLCNEQMDFLYLATHMVRAVGVPATPFLRAVAFHTARRSLRWRLLRHAEHVSSISDDQRRAVAFLHLLEALYPNPSFTVEHNRAWTRRLTGSFPAWGRAAREQAAASAAAEDEDLDAAEGSGQAERSPRTLTPSAGPFLRATKRGMLASPGPAVPRVSPGDVWPPAAHARAGDTEIEAVCVSRAVLEGGAAGSDGPPTAGAATLDARGIGAGRLRPSVGNAGLVDLGALSDGEDEGGGESVRRATRTAESVLTEAARRQSQGAGSGQGRANAAPSAAHTSLSFAYGKEARAAAQRRVSGSGPTTSLSADAGGDGRLDHVAVSSFLTGDLGDIGAVPSAWGFHDRAEIGLRSGMSDRYGSLRSVAADSDEENEEDDEADSSAGSSTDSSSESNSDSSFDSSAGEGTRDGPGRTTGQSSRGRRRRPTHRRRATPMSSRELMGGAREEAQSDGESGMGRVPLRRSSTAGDPPARRSSSRPSSPHAGPLSLPTSPTSSRAPASPATRRQRRQAHAVEAATGAVCLECSRRAHEGRGEPAAPVRARGYLHLTLAWVQEWPASTRERVLLEAQHRVHQRDAGAAIAFYAQHADWRAVVAWVRELRVESCTTDAAGLLLGRPRSPVRALELVQSALEAVADAPAFIRDLMQRTLAQRGVLGLADSEGAGQDGAADTDISRLCQQLASGRRLFAPVRGSQEARSGVEAAPPADLSGPLPAGEASAVHTQMVSWLARQGAVRALVAYADAHELGLTRKALAAIPLAGSASWVPMVLTARLGDRRAFFEASVHHAALMDAATPSDGEGQAAADENAAPTLDLPTRGRVSAMLERGEWSAALATLMYAPVTSLDDCVAASDSGPVAQAAAWAVPRDTLLREAGTERSHVRQALVQHTTLARASRIARAALSARARGAPPTAVERMLAQLPQPQTPSSPALPGDVWTWSGDVGAAALATDATGWRLEEALAEARTLDAAEAFAGPAGAGDGRSLVVGADRAELVPLVREEEAGSVVELMGTKLANFSSPGLTPPAPLHWSDVDATYYLRHRRPLYAFHHLLAGLEPGIRSGRDVRVVRVAGEAERRSTASRVELSQRAMERVVRLARGAALGAVFDRGVLAACATLLRLCDLETDTLRVDVEAATRVVAHRVAGWLLQHLQTRSTAVQRASEARRGQRGPSEGKESATSEPVLLATADVLALLHRVAWAEGVAHKRAERASRDVLARGQGDEDEEDRDVALVATPEAIREALLEREAKPAEVMRVVAERMDMEAFLAARAAAQREVNALFGAFPVAPRKEGPLSSSRDEEEEAEVEVAPSATGSLPVMSALRALGEATRAVVEDSGEEDGRPGGRGKETELSSVFLYPESPWKLVTLFCRVHGLPRSLALLQELARRNDWVIFLHESERERCPPGTVVSIVRNNFADLRLRDHLYIVAQQVALDARRQRRKERAFAAGGSGGDTPSVPRLQSGDVFESGSPTAAGASKEGEDVDEEAMWDRDMLAGPPEAGHLFDVLCGCAEQAAAAATQPAVRAEHEPAWRKLLDSALQLQRPLLAAVAMCFSGASCLDALVTWLAVQDTPLPLPLRWTRRHADGRGSVVSSAAEEEGSADASGVEERAGAGGGPLCVPRAGVTDGEFASAFSFLLRGQQFSVLTRGLRLFDPDHVLLPFVLFAQAFSQRRYTAAREELQHVVSRLNAAAGASPSRRRAGAADPDESASGVQSLGAVASDLSLVRSVVEAELQHMRTSLLDHPRECEELLAVVAGTEFSLSYARQYAVFSLLRRTGLQQEADIFTEPERILDLLLDRRLFSEARRFTKDPLHALSTHRHRVTRSQIEAMLGDLKQSELWALPDERARLWGACVAVLEEHEFPPDQAGRFFLETADSLRSEVTPEEYLALVRGAADAFRRPTAAPHIPGPFLAALDVLIDVVDAGVAAGAGRGYDTFPSLLEAWDAGAMGQPGDAASRAGTGSEVDGTAASAAQAAVPGALADAEEGGPSSSVSSADGAGSVIDRDRAVSTGSGAVGGGEAERRARSGSGVYASAVVGSAGTVPSAAASATDSVRSTSHTPAHSAEATSVQSDAVGSSAGRAERVEGSRGVLGRASRAAVATNAPAAHTRLHQMWRAPEPPQSETAAAFLDRAVGLLLDEERVERAVAACRQYRHTCVDLEVVQAAKSMASAGRVQLRPVARAQAPSEAVTAGDLELPARVSRALEARFPGADCRDLGVTLEMLASLCVHAHECAARVRIAWEAAAATGQHVEVVMGGDACVTLQRLMEAVVTGAAPAAGGEGAHDSSGRERASAARHGAGNTRVVASSRLTEAFAEAFAVEELAVAEVGGAVLAAAVARGPQGTADAEASLDAVLRVVGDAELLGDALCAAASAAAPSSPAREDAMRREASLLVLAHRAYVAAVSMRGVAVVLGRVRERAPAWLNETGGSRVTGALVHGVEEHHNLRWLLSTMAARGTLAGTPPARGTGCRDIEMPTVSLARFLVDELGEHEPDTCVAVLRATQDWRGVGEVLSMHAERALARCVASLQHVCHHPCDLLQRDGGADADMAAALPPALHGGEWEGVSAEVVAGLTLSVEAGGAFQRSGCAMKAGRCARDAALVALQLEWVAGPGQAGRGVGRGGALLGRTLPPVRLLGLHTADEVSAAMALCPTFAAAEIVANAYGDTVGSAVDAVWQSVLWRRTALHGDCAFAAALAAARGLAVEDVCSVVRGVLAACRRSRQKEARAAVPPLVRLFLLSYASRTADVENVRATVSECAALAEGEVVHTAGSPPWVQGCHDVLAAVRLVVEDCQRANEA